MSSDAATAEQEAYSWGLDRINNRGIKVIRTWEKVNAKEVKVFIFDTGIDGTPPEFEDAIDPTDSCHTNCNLADKDGCKSDFPLDDEDRPLFDATGHGTSVASVACGKYCGVAVCKLCSVKIHPSNELETFKRLKRALTHVVKECGEGISFVINYSQSWPEDDVVFDAMFRNTVKKGIVVVASAGNIDTDACKVSPASEPQVITAGAINKVDKRWFVEEDGAGTNWGPCVNVWAPGSDITAAWPSHLKTQYQAGWNVMTGTSFAAPHVAGLAAGYLSQGVRILATGDGTEQSPGGLSIPVVKAGKAGIDSKNEKAGIALMPTKSVYIVSFEGPEGDERYGRVCRR